MTINPLKRPMIVAPVLPLIICLLTTLILLGLHGYFTTSASTQVPVHWGIHGQPDRLGGRAEAFLLIPVVGIVLGLLLTLLPEFARGVTRANLEKSAHAWRVCTVAPLAILLLVQIGIQAAATNPSFPTARLILISVSLLFVILGAVLSKTRPNPWLGVRTPWTLRNEVAWTRTHRAAAHCFVGVGLTSALLGAVAPIAAASGFLVSGMLASSIWLVLYSRNICLAEEGKGAKGS